MTVQIPLQAPVGSEDLEAQARKGIRALLRIVGEDPDRAGLRDTPNRVIRAYRELCSHPGDPERLLSRQFDLDDTGSVVVVGPVSFVSVCEHHLLPFHGTVWLAYLPSGDRVVGLSKLPRLVHHFAARPQVQERLTTQITGAMDEHLSTSGSGCVVRAVHSCMTLRGVKADGSAMVTSSLTGQLKTDPRARSEFLDLTRER